MQTGHSTRTRTLAALTALALAGGGAALLSTSSPAAAAEGGALVFGLTTDDRLVTFRAGTLSADAGREITGLGLADDVVGIDIRPSTGQIIGLVSSPTQDRLITIDPATGASTALDTLDVQLSGTAFGVDVNPVPDALRIVSNSGQNLRHPLPGGPTTADTNLTYGSGQAPQVTAAAYTNSVDGATTTQLFDIDSARDVLALQNPPNDGALAVVGPLGVDVLTNNGFDVDASGGTAYASLQTPTGVALYTVNLSTGAATRLGGLPNTIEDIAVSTPRFVVDDATVTEGSTAQVTVRRLGDTADSLTVDFATTNGSAGEGADYTRTTGTLTFAAGETSKTISVPTSLAGGLEGRETFDITLSRPSGGAVLSPATGTVTINDGETGTAYALTTTNAIRTFTVNDPAAAGTTVPVLGLQPGEDLIGIDVRPANNQLYGVSAAGRIYTINPSTGVAAQSGNTITPALSGTSFGVDFNPAADRLRIVSNNGQNLRVNADSGDTIVDMPLRFASGSGTPAVAAAGYTNNTAGAATTELLDIDTATDALVRQVPADSGTLTPVGALGVAVPATATVGLDISNLGGNAFALLQTDTVPLPSLYRVDTSSGAVRLLGTFNNATSTVEDLALAPATQATASPTPSSTATASPTASASASASATATASPTGTASPRPTGTATAPSLPFCTNRLTVTRDQEFIIPTIAVRVTVTGAAPGALVDLQAYSRPTTDYGSVRTAPADENGRIVFDVTPGTNTRLFAQCVSERGGEGQPGSASVSTVINVRTALSLSVVRNGTRNYTFQGRILPRRADQLITLYRVEDDGTRVITSQLKTDSTGTYRFRRQFTGSGTFGFLARTGQTLTNAAGESTSPQRQRSAEYLATGRGTPRPTAIF